MPPSLPAAAPAAPAAALRGVPLIALSCLLFAAMAVAAKSLSGGLSPGQLVLARFVVGLGVMGGWYLARGSRPAAPRPLLWALRGLLGGGAVFLYFVAIDRLQVGPATVLNYSSPIYAAAFGAWFLGERVSLRTGVGILLATVGVVLVTWTTLDPTQPLTLGVGAWAGVVSAIFGGAAQTVIRALRRDTDAGSVFFSFCLFGLLWALPFAVGDWRPLSSGLLLPALVMGLLSTGAQLLFTYAFAYTSAAVGSATTQLTPAFTWLLGVGLLGDSVHPLALAGSLLCVGGVLWGSSRWPRTQGQLPLLATAQAHPLVVAGREPRGARGK